MSTPDTFETTGAQALVNRLSKNQRHWGRWARRAGVSCYRVYDADLPEYAVAIDRYGDRLCVQEYAAPTSVEPELAAARLRDVVVAVVKVMDVTRDRVAVKVRRRQRGSDQYVKRDSSGEFLEVEEGPCRLLVNLRDYLDTGLFLDHRDTRMMLGEWAAGARFLNLFCYTAAATCHAVRGGATASLSVDLSKTYTDWAARNLQLNGADPASHRVERADCLRWLREPPTERFDLIFLDPPTFSNSKRMAEPFDVLRGHVGLIRDSMARLAGGGTLIFSTNHRRFELDDASLSDLDVRDITRQTIPPDFARNPRIHHCYRIRHRT